MNRARLTVDFCLTWQSPVQFMSLPSSWWSVKVCQAIHDFILLLKVRHRPQRKMSLQSCSQTKTLKVQWTHRKMVESSGSGRHIQTVTSNRAVRFLPTYWILERADKYQVASLLIFVSFFPNLFPLMWFCANLLSTEMKTVGGGVALWEFSPWDCQPVAIATVTRLTRGCCFLIWH